MLTEVRLSSWALSAFVAWCFSMMVTGAFALSGFVLPTDRLLPERYYRIRRPERLGALYRGLGVDVFRRALLATLWRRRAMQRAYFDGSASGLDHLAARSRASEFGHVVPFVLLTVAGSMWIASGAAGLGLWTLAVNVHLYPVLLQRHHRMRIQRMRAITQRRSHRPRRPLSGREAR